MTLLERQVKFAVMVAELILWAYQQKYDLTFGRAYDPPELQEWYVKQGTGNKSSLLPLRLAVDLNLSKNGIYLTELKDYEPLGVFFESLGGSWGGRFKRPDADHFSLSWNGVR